MLGIQYIYYIVIRIKIRPNQEVDEFDPDADREYIDMDTDGYSLIAPERWEPKKCRLRFMLQNYASTFNRRATEWLIHCTPRRINL